VTSPVRSVHSTPTAPLTHGIEAPVQHEAIIDVDAASSTPASKKRVRKPRGTASGTVAATAPLPPKTFDLMIWIPQPDKVVRSNTRSTRKQKQPPLKHGPTSIPFTCSWLKFLSILAASDMLNVSVERLRTATFQWRFSKPANAVSVPVTNQKGLNFMGEQVMTKPPSARLVILEMAEPKKATASSQVRIAAPYPFWLLIYALS
jgi:hypothetical protein